MANLTPPAEQGKVLESVIVEAIQDYVRKIATEEAEAAAQRVKERVQGKLGELVGSVASAYTYYPMPGHIVRIEVDTSKLTKQGD